MEPSAAPRDGASTVAGLGLATRRGRAAGLGLGSVSTVGVGVGTCGGDSISSEGCGGTTGAAGAAGGAMIRMLTAPTAVPARTCWLSAGQRKSSRACSASASTPATTSARRCWGGSCAMTKGCEEGSIFGISTSRQPRCSFGTVSCRRSALASARALGRGRGFLGHGAILSSIRSCVLLG